MYDMLSPRAAQFPMGPISKVGANKASQPSAYRPFFMGSALAFATLSFQKGLV